MTLRARADQLLASLNKAMVPLARLTVELNDSGCASCNLYCRVNGDQRPESEKSNKYNNFPSFNTIKHVCVNQLVQNLNASKHDERWVSDIYLDFVQLAVIVDLFLPKIIDWVLYGSMTNALITDAFDMAVVSRKMYSPG